MKLKTLTGALNKTLAVAVVAVGLTGCVAHSWAPGPGRTAADFGPTKGRCELLAISGETAALPTEYPATQPAAQPATVTYPGGGTVITLPRDDRWAGVGQGFGAGLAAGFANRVQHNRIFNACMEASGFMRVPVQ